MTLQQLLELRSTVAASIGTLEGMRAERALSTNQEKALAKYHAQITDLDAQIEETRAADSEAAERRAQTVASLGAVDIRDAIAMGPGAGRLAHVGGREAGLTEVRSVTPAISAGASVSTRDRTLSVAEVRAVEDFRNYLRTGETRALSATSDAAGGYVVPHPIVQELTEAVRKADPILDLAARFNLRGGNSTTELPHKATHGDVLATDDFATARTAEQTNPGFASRELSCIDYHSDQRATRHWIKSTPGGEDLVMRWIIEDVYEQLGTDIAVGNGTDTALGLFAATSHFDVLYSDADGAIANTDFMALYTALHPKFRANGSWLMNSATLATCLGMVYPNTDQPLVQWVNGQPTILGRPVREASSAPTLGTDTVPVAFGDIAQAYAIGEHDGPEVLVDQVTKTPLIRYVGVARLGGSPWHPDACVLLVSGAEASV